MRIGLIAASLCVVVALPALAQNQRPTTQSPYDNVHHYESVADYAWVPGYWSCAY